MSRLIRVLAVLVFAVVSVSANGQDYPTKSVVFVVANPPGGGADAIGRATAQALSGIWGQSVVVENRAGANQSIAVEYVVSGAADGYTLLLIETSVLINPSLYPDLRYDPSRDLAPITGLVGWSHLVIVNPSLPVKNLSDLVQLAKSKPGQVVYASPGSGSIPHLVMELFQSMTGTRLIHAPYKGGGPALNDVVAGHVAMTLGTVTLVQSQWKAGKVNVIAVASSKRIPELPTVPTSAEAGLPDFQTSAWFGVVAKANTPRNIISRINADIQKVFSDPAFRAKNLAPQGYESITSSPESFADRMRSDTQKWGNIVREAKVKAE